MGFFDKIIDVAKEIDKTAGGNTGLSELAEMAGAKVRNEISPDTGGSSNTNSNVTTKSTTGYENMLTESYVSASSLLVIDGVKYQQIIEICPNFHEINPGAEGIDVEYVLASHENDNDLYNLDKPSIAITTMFEDQIREFQNTSTIANSFLCEKLNEGNFLFRAKINYYDMIAYFYALNRSVDNQVVALAMLYKPKYASTSLEQGLINALDHAASTYQIIKD